MNEALIGTCSQIHLTILRLDEYVDGNYYIIRGEEKDIRIAEILLNSIKHVHVPGYLLIRLP